MHLLIVVRDLHVGHQRLGIAPDLAAGQLGEGLVDRQDPHRHPWHGDDPCDGDDEEGDTELVVATEIALAIVDHEDRERRLAGEDLEHPQRLFVRLEDLRDVRGAHEIVGRALGG
jgi:hypothetical protein